MNFLSSIRARLIATAVLLILLFIGGIGYAIFAMNQISQEVTGMAENDIPLTAALIKVTTDQLEQAILFERAVRYGEIMADQPKLRAKFEEEVGKFEALDTEIIQDYVVAGKQVADVLARARNTVEIEVFTHVSTEMEKIETEYAGFVRDSQSVFNGLRKNVASAELEALIETVEAKETQLDSALEALVLELEGFTANAAFTVTQHGQTALLVLSALGALIVMLTMVLNSLSVRQVTQPIGRITGALNQLREGNREARTGFRGGNEITTLGAELDTMLDARDARDIQDAEESQQLNSSVMDVLRSVSILGKGDLTAEVPMAEDITGALGDAINQMTENMIETLELVTQSSANVINASGEVNAMAQSGKDAVVKNTEAMNEIRNTIQETAKRIKRLGERSQDINGIVKVINDISERTSVLALNANMQAAAAGEAGRGFMVVANEVQRLAESSQEATKQIGKLVDTIQTETGDTIVAMDKGIEEVVKGAELAEEAASQMDKTVATLDSLNRVGEQLKASVAAFKLPSSAKI